MKRIQLGNGYVIDVGAYDYTLKNNIKVIEKDGKEIESSNTLGYYNDFEGAIQKLYKEKVKDKLKNNNNISELVSAVKEAKAEIKELLKEFNF